VKIPLRRLQHCLEGHLYPMIASCAPDGTPNISVVSYVGLVDDEHVALGMRFLSRTPRNVAANPRASVLLVDTRTCRQHLLDLELVRSETSGPRYEQMRVRFDGIAAVSGIKGIVKPASVDIYRVLDYRPLDRGYLPEPPERPIAAAAVRELTVEIGACEDLSALLDVTLRGLARHLHYGHSMILLSDPGTTKLYAVASHGYATSGAGAEVEFGNGVIGVAAAERRPILITHAGREERNNRWVRRRAQELGDDPGVEREIPLIGLPEAQSRLAVPILGRGRLLGVLYLERTAAGDFVEEDETTLVALAGQLGTAILLCAQSAAQPSPAPVPGPISIAPSGPPLLVRRYELDQSVFIGDDYLIKGVAGAILWKLLNSYRQEGRTEFSNRELRLDRALGLPDVGDNLEARLVLLQRRLVDRSAHIRLEKVARARVRLTVARPLELRSIGRV
jgi:adenylate cyclase